MSKIILISAPYIDCYGPIKLAAGNYFPLGIGYIASFLRQHGHEVLLYEPESQNLDYVSLSKILSDEKPDVVGISSATPNFFNAIKLAKIAKNVCRCKVVYGGVHASSVPEFIIEKYHEYFDFIVVGEGEYTILELLDCLENKIIPLDIPGLCFWHNDQIITTKKRPLITELDNLPYPARDLIPQNLFSPNMHNRRYKQCITILTSRGCPYNCSFCASFLTMGKEYRMHSAEYVLEEMEFLKKKYNAKQLIINDDTFTIDKQRLIAICEGMIKKKLNIKWFCFSQITSVDKEILKLMSASGCYSIGFGFESASEETLKSIGKMVPLEKGRMIVAAANKLGIKTQAFFVFGKENESSQDIENTIQYAIDLNPTLAFFNMLVPYPGTRDFNYFFKNVPLDQIEWDNFVCIGTKSVILNSSERMLNLETMTYNANKRFYFRPHQIFHILSRISTFHELYAYLKGGIGLFCQMRTWKHKQD